MCSSDLPLPHTPSPNPLGWDLGGRWHQKPLVLIPRLLLENEEKAVAPLETLGVVFIRFFNRKQKTENRKLIKGVGEGGGRPGEDTCATGTGFPRPSPRQRKKGRRMRFIQSIWSFRLFLAAALVWGLIVSGPAAAAPPDPDREEQQAGELKLILQRADAALHNQKTAEAEKAYRRALKLKPDSPEAHYGLGLALARQGRYQEALGAFDQAVRLSPTWARVHKDRGVALLKLNRPGDAAQAFRTALRHHPDDPETYYNLGMATGKQERHREAQEAFAAAVRLKPDYLQAWNNLGLARLKLERWPEARQAFEAALRLNPNSPEAHLGLMACLIQQGDGDGAAREYQTLKKLNPDLAQKAAELLSR